MVKNSKLFKKTPEEEARWKKAVDGWERQVSKTKYQRKFNNKYTPKGLYD